MVQVLNASIYDTESQLKYYDEQSKIVIVYCKDVGSLYNAFFFILVASLVILLSELLMFAVHTKYFSAWNYEMELMDQENERKKNKRRPVVLSEKKVNFVLHHAALGSVPKSVQDPVRNNEVNIDGFLNVLVSARDAKVDRFVYATSSSIYGESGSCPISEKQIGRPLTPYALSKFCNEMYAAVFKENYSVKCVGLRYFNIFGKRQDPSGSYSAVIPKWISAMNKNEPIYIFGDGKTSRDFCHVDNVVQANLLAALKNDNDDTNAIYNVGTGKKISLESLFKVIYFS